MKRQISVLTFAIPLLILNGLYSAMPTTPADFDQTMANIPPPPFSITDAPVLAPTEPSSVFDEIAPEIESEVIPDLLPQGPDTITTPANEIGDQGNWQKKKDWLKQAQIKNDAIQEMVLSIQNIRTNFSDQYKTANEKLNTFYQKSGFEQGKLDGLFSEINSHITKLKEKNIKFLEHSDLDNEQAALAREKYIDIYMIESEYKQQKKDLDKLKLNIKSIAELNTSVNNRMKKVDEQITKAQQFADQASAFTEKIWHIIDDKKARKLFYDISALQEQTNAIQQYVQVDLSSDFSNVIQTITSQITKIDDAIKKLEDQEIFLTQREKKVAQIKKEKAKKLQMQETLQRVKKIKHPQESSWFDWFWSFFS